MKKRIVSTVIISVLVLINLFIFTTRLMPLDLTEFIGSPLPEDPDGITLMWTALAAGVAMLTFIGWAASIAITHAICLIFTIKNRKSPLKAVRIINLVLDAANVFLIVAPIVRIILW